MVHCLIVYVLVLLFCVAQGGVIMTRADNTKVNTIQDLKDKVIAAGSISVLMSAQLQFYIMQRAGLSYVNDPKQVVFTGNQFDVGKICRMKHTNLLIPFLVN